MCMWVTVFPEWGRMNRLELQCGGCQEAWWRSRGPARGAAQPGSFCSGIGVVFVVVCIWKQREREKRITSHACRD